MEPPDAHSASLITAAAAGHVEVIRELLRAGASVHARMADGRSALHLACANNHLPVVRVLLEAGAHQAGDAANALEVAVNTNRAEIVRVLLEAGVRPGPAALVIAAGRGDVEMVQLLLQAGCDVNAPGSYPCQTALVEVIVRYGSARLPSQKKRKQQDGPPRDPYREVFDLLLAAGAGPNARDEGGSTALHAAVVSDAGSTLIPLLLAAGANPNVANYEGTTPLMECLHVEERSGDARLDRLHVLLAAGANPNLRDMRGQSVLHRASKCRGAEPAVRALIEAGADVNACDAFGRTPLMLLADAAEIYKNVPAVRALIEAGADINARDRGNIAVLGHATEGHNRHEQGAEVIAVLQAAGARNDVLREIALRQAAAEGDRERVRALIAEGVEVNATTWGDSYYTRPAGTMPAGPAQTALVNAVCRGHADIVRDLLAAGARADLPSVSDAHPGVSLLIAGVWSGSADVVQALLAAGGDASRPDSLGRTPLLYAARMRNRPIVDLLRAAGAPVDVGAADFLKVMDFPEAAQRREYTGAVAELAAACDTEPIAVEGLPGVTCFRMRSEKRACELRQASPDMHRLNAEFAAEHQVLMESQARFFDRFFADGISLVRVYFRRFSPTGLGLFPTTDPFAIVAAVGPYQKDDPAYAIDLLKSLHEFAEEQSFRVIGCGATSVDIELKASTPPEGTMFAFQPVEGKPGHWWGNVWWDD